VKVQPFFNKPKPGTALWTSSYLGEKYGSDWIQWMLTSSTQDTFDCYLLTPDLAARIYTINTLAHLSRLQEKFPYVPEELRAHIDQGAGYYNEHRFIDFEAAAREYDAIHVTVEGQWETRFSFPANLYGWDCESTCWFRGNFQIEHIGIKSYEV